MNRRERRAQKVPKAKVAAGPSADAELSCSCGWPLPGVWLAFDPSRPKPDYAAALELLRGVSVRLDCPMCGRVHLEPMGADGDEAAAAQEAQEAPIRGIPFISTTPLLRASDQSPIIDWRRAA